MSQKNSPKIIKVDLQKKNEQTLSKRKYQISKRGNKKYQSPKPLKTLQFKSKKKESQSLHKSLDASGEQKQIKREENQEFSFSQENNKSNQKFSYFKGQGYELMWKNTVNLNDSILEKLTYFHLNVGLKIFQLCNKSFQFDLLKYQDLDILEKNLIKHLKVIYGNKNENLIRRRSVQIKENMKVIFNRKAQISFEEGIYLMIDCEIDNALINLLMQIFPLEIKAF